MMKIILVQQARLLIEDTKAQMNLNNYYSFQVPESLNEALLFYTDILTFLPEGISCLNCAVFHSREHLY